MKPSFFKPTEFARVLFTGLLMSIVPVITLITTAYWLVHSEIREDNNQALTALETQLEEVLMNVKQLDALSFKQCDQAGQQLLANFFYEHLNGGLFLVRRHDAVSPLFCSITGPIQHLIHGSMHAFPVVSEDAERVLFGVQEAQTQGQPVYLFLGYIGDEQVSASRINLPDRFSFFEPELMHLRRVDLRLDDQTLITSLGYYPHSGIGRLMLKSQKYPITISAVISWERIWLAMLPLALQLSPVLVLLWSGGVYLMLLLQQSQQSIFSRLKRAVRRNEFVAYYQPIVDVKQQRIVGAEALIRWRRRDGRIESPANFIEALESSALIHRVTKQLVRDIPDDLGEILTLDDEFRCSVNIVPDHLEADDFMNFLKQLSQEGYPCRQLALEITERLPLKNLAVVQQSILRAHELGIVVELDDAGTGYGGASYLQELNLDIIKVDKLFVDALGLHGQHSPIIDAYIQLGNSLNMNIIAEGVESETQSRLLAEKNVYLQQGYLFAKPMTAQEFVQFYLHYNQQAAVTVAPEPYDLMNKTTSLAV